MKRLLTFERILGLNIRQCYDTIVLSVFTVKRGGFWLVFLMFSANPPRINRSEDS